MLHAVKSTSTYTPKKMGTSTLNIIFLSLLKRSFFFFSLKVESKATCLILHFFFHTIDLIVNKTHQFQYSKRQNKSWKKWELMHILLFEWRLRARVLAATPGIGIGYVF